MQASLPVGGLNVTNIKGGSIDVRRPKSNSETTSLMVHFGEVQGSNLHGYRLESVLQEILGR